MTTGRALFVGTCMAICCATSGHAQRAGVGRYRDAQRSLTPTPKSAAPDSTTSSGEAFVVEAAGGMLGSAVGIGVVALSTSCGGDDLGCGILKVGSAGIVGAIGATIGTTLAARHTGSRRSVLGAALGAVVGTGAGVTVHYFLTRAGGSSVGDKAAIAAVIVSQGLVSAAGSRLLGR